jgi:hypothetical protein
LIGLAHRLVLHVATEPLVIEFQGGLNISNAMGTLAL